MPMTLNVGLSKKIGQPDYGSLGASCHVEVELDGSLLREDLEKFHTHVRNAFIACRQAVQDELARHQTGEPHVNGSAGNGHSSSAPSNGNGRNGARRTGSRRATASQVRAIVAIANRQGLDLVRELRERYQVERAEDLGIAEASQLIDDLKATPNGTGDRR